MIIPKRKLIILRAYIKQNFRRRQGLHSGDLTPASGLLRH